MVSIKSFPNNQDEYIGAEDVMRWLHGRTSGVFGADHQASVAPAIGSRGVTVSDGHGWLSDDAGNGVVWWIDEDQKTGHKLTLPVDIADGLNPRIDRVVVSWETVNFVERPQVYILKGNASSNPVPRELTNNAQKREISLARINIPAGTMEITSDMITDERLDPGVCGIVTAGVGIDTSVMQAQFDEFFRKAFKEQRDYMGQQIEAWSNYFNGVQNQTLLPVPTPDNAGKVLSTTKDGRGYTFSDVQDHIPVTSNPGKDVEIWIDPGEEAEQDGAVLNYKDPLTGEIKKVGAPVSDSYTKKETDSKLATKAPAYSYGTDDLTAGESALETGKLYFVYE